MGFKEWFGGGEDPREKGVPAPSETGNDTDFPKEEEVIPKERAERKAVDELEKEGLGQ